MYLFFLYFFILYAINELYFKRKYNKSKFLPTNSIYLTSNNYNNLTLLFSIVT